MASDWEPVHSLVEDAGLWGRGCSSPLPSGSACCMPPSLPLVGERGLYTVGWLSSFGIRSILCSVRRPGCVLEPFVEKFSLSFFLFGDPQCGLLSHLSSLRLSSGHSGLVLTLSNAARTSLFSPRLLVVNALVWATSPLEVAVSCIICGFYLFIFSSRLCCPLRFQNSPQTH